MRLLVAIALVASGCAGSVAGPPDAGPVPSDLAEVVASGDAPVGFGAACKQSSDCRGFAVDAGPGFLGCASYLGIGADYCTLPCAGAADCWSGSTCMCVNRINAGGQPEKDCYCAK